MCGESPPTSHMGQANAHSFALAYPPTEDLPTSTVSINLAVF